MFFCFVDFGVCGLMVVYVCVCGEWRVESDFGKCVKIYDGIW